MGTKGTTAIASAATPGVQPLVADRQEVVRKKAPLASGTTTVRDSTARVPDRDVFLSNPNNYLLQNLLKAKERYGVTRSTQIVELEEYGDQGSVSGVYDIDEDGNPDLYIVTGPPANPSAEPENTPAIANSDQTEVPLSHSGGPDEVAICGASVYTGFCKSLSLSDAPYDGAMIDDKLTGDNPVTLAPGEVFYDPPTGKMDDAYELVCESESGCDIVVADSGNVKRHNLDAQWRPVTKKQDQP